jgi:hypothetical protein
MSIIGEATSLAGLLGKAWDWYQERRDPAYLSAKRIIAAFEAHGVKRQQIVRLLPPLMLQGKPELTMADFSSPKRLKAKLSPALLDWAAEYLNMQRAWLDGLEVRPHVVVDHYKQPAIYREWLQSRQTQVPNVFRVLSVWKGVGQRLDEDDYGEGPLCLVYEETADGLDGTELSRYWLLSDEWSLNHAPCVENMVAAVAVAKSVGIVVTGRDVPLDKLQRLEAGELLVPEAALLIKASWHPEDLVAPMQGNDTPWRQALWRDAQGWLKDTSN